MRLFLSLLLDRSPSIPSVGADLLPGMTYEVDWPFQVSALFGMALYYSSPTGYYAQYSLEDPSGDVTLTLQDYGVGCPNPAVELASRRP
jgi:hypothetical protein